MIKANGKPVMRIEYVAHQHFEIETSGSAFACITRWSCDKEFKELQASHDAFFDSNSGRGDDIACLIAKRISDLSSRSLYGEK